MRAPFGGPPPAATSGSWRLVKPGAFALLLVHLGTSVTCKFTMIWEFLFCRTHQSSDRELRLKIPWCGEPLRSTTQQIFTLTKGWTTLPAPRAAGAEFSRQVEAAKRWPSGYQIVPSTDYLGAFRLPWLRCEFSSVVRWMPGYNTKSGHGPHSPR
jgi:hypothetical protein